MGISKIHFIGMGALGSSFAAQVLKNHPQELRVIAGEKRQKKLADGIFVNGQHFNLTFADPREAAELIIVAVKYPELSSAIADMAPYVGPNTLILTILNGLKSYEILQKAFGAEKVIAGFGIAMDCSKNGNHIFYKNLGRITFGDETNTNKSERILRVEKFFERNQIPYEIPKDMNRAMWFKFMLNTGVNQASSFLGLPFIEFQKDGEPRELMKSAAQEVINIAKAKDVDLRDSDIEVMVDIINKLDPHGKTSMLQDIEAGRKTEVEYFSGHILEMGRGLGIATPINEKLLKEIKKLESR